MDLHFLFFRLFPALQFIFKLNYIPQEKDFKELTPEQYVSFHRKEVDNEDFKDLSDKRLYAFLPDDPKVYNRIVEMYGDNLAIIGEEDFASFAKASEYIEMSCNESGKHFDDITDKLGYLATQLPDVFTEGTQYALHGKRK